MRALASSIYLLLLLPLAALGAAPSASLRNNVKSERGTTGFSNSSLNSALSQTSSVDMQSGSFFSNADFQLGLDRVKTNYSRYIVTDRSGTQTELSKSFNEPEYTIRAGASLYLKQTKLSLGGSKSVGLTPFPGNSLAASLIQDFSAFGTKVQLRLARSDHSAPDSFYIDPDIFSTKRRPNRSLETRATVGTEQIVSETAKIKLSIFAADKPGTRPMQRGGEIALAKGLSDSHALLLSIGAAREKTSDPLLDDRGYFEADWANLEYRFQPTYQWDFSAKVGTILERESARGRLPKHKVGTDMLGISALSRWKIGEVGAFALIARSNTGYQSLSLGGNLTWNL